MQRTNFTLECIFNMISVRSKWIPTKCTEADLETKIKKFLSIGLLWANEGNDTRLVNLGP